MPPFAMWLPIEMKKKEIITRSRAVIILSYSVDNNTQNYQFYQLPIRKNKNHCHLDWGQTWVIETHCSSTSFKVVWKETYFGKGVTEVFFLLFLSFREGNWNTESCFLVRTLVWHPTWILLKSAMTKYFCAIRIWKMMNFRLGNEIEEWSSQGKEKKALTQLILSVCKTAVIYERNESVAHR